jgi:4-hydroxy-3-methylbut-2-enyl diphosphate reductase
MQIVLANPRGFCAGVDRAIDIVERALQLFGAPIYVRHEVVHNRHVVERLRGLGAVFVEQLNEVPDGATVVFSAHGVSTAVENEASRRALQVFDATCPLVTKVHMEVSHFAREAREVILIGHAGHPEIEGTMGRFDTSFGGQIFLVESIEDVQRVAVRDPSRLAFVTQTTLSVDDTALMVAALQGAFSIAAGAAARGYLLRDAEPPGRGQEAARALRSAAGGRLAQQLQFQSAARTGRSRRHPGLPGGRRR